MVSVTDEEVTMSSRIHANDPKTGMSKEQFGVYEGNKWVLVKKVSHNLCALHYNPEQLALLFGIDDGVVVKIRYSKQTGSYIFYVESDKHGSYSRKPWDLAPLIKSVTPLACSYCGSESTGPKVTTTSASVNYLTEGIGIYGQKQDEGWFSRALAMIKLILYWPIPWPRVRIEIVREED